LTDIVLDKDKILSYLSKALSATKQMGKNGLKTDSQEAPLERPSYSPGVLWERHTNLDAAHDAFRVNARCVSCWSQVAAKIR